LDIKILKQGLFTGERALYNSKSLRIYDSTFADGESPLKESSDIEIYGSIFKWKYPLWYCKDIKTENSVLLETARSGIWYTENITMTDCVIEAPKTFRRSSGITLKRCNLPHASETMWSCRDIILDEVNTVGDYFGMNSENITADRLVIDGNYAFDGGKNIEIKNSKLISKDAFWNCENVTVYDSVIIGEYLGWNSKNVTFVNCTLESNQGLCYMEGVKLVNCKLLNTDLAFEYSTVDAEVTTEIDSVKNPISGRIHAEAIREIIMEKTLVDPEKTKITTER
jgi:hypothetical protein